MKIIEDIKSFLDYLSFVDIFFFVAIIVLLILVVTLIYFIKINKDEVDEMTRDTGHKDNNDLENDILNLIENPPTENNSPAEDEDLANPEEYSDEDAPLIDLETLTKKLENQKEQDENNITAYEKDQEEKAIISYDELLKKKNNYAINYEKEEVLDDLVVKKVDLNDLVNKNVIDNVKEVRVISYQKEEAFLNALKELNRLLN